MVSSNQYVGFTDVITVAEGGNRKLSYELQLDLSGYSRDIDLPENEDPLEAYKFNWTCFNLNKNATCHTLENKLLIIN